MTKYYWTGDDWVDASMFKRAPSKAPMVITDTCDPFQSMADGRVYTSRREYRRSLREHGMIEVGDQKDAFMNQKGPELPPMEESLKEAYQQCEAGKGVKPKRLPKQWDNSATDHLGVVK